MVPFGHFWAPFDLSKVPDCKSNFISLTYHYRYSFHPNSTFLTCFENSPRALYIFPVKVNHTIEMKFDSNWSRYIWEIHIIKPNCKIKGKNTAKNYNH
jgi:hypothetical protein